MQIKKTHSFKFIKIGDLKLDSFNPRLPKSLEGATEAQIIEYMLLDASLLELMMAIGENGFFAGEQLLVVLDKDKKYLVVEGNRRLTAVKLLSDKNLATVQKSKVGQVFSEAKHRPKEIPCLIFEGKDLILKYLGYRHITGVKSWKLLEKARYLYNLKIETYPNTPFHDAARELAKIIGSRKDYVQRIIGGYELYKIIEDNKFYKIRGLDDTTFHFNYIADSLNHSNIEKYLGVDFSKTNPIENVNISNLKEWTFWLFEKNDQNKTRLLGTSGDLLKLNKILGDQQAIVAFSEKKIDLIKAYELTEDIDTMFIDSINRSLDYLEQSDSVGHRVSVPYIDVQEQLLAIRRLTTKIKQTLENLDEDDL